MENNQNQQQIDSLTQRITALENAFGPHEHNGLDSNVVQLFNLFGFIKSIKTSAELTQILTASPQAFYSQFFLYTANTGLYNLLYLYDTSGTSTNPWTSFGNFSTTGTIPSTAPQNPSDQIVFYKSGATLRLYFYDLTNSTWHYVTMTA